MFVVIKMDNKSVEATPACAPGHSRWHLEKDFHIIRFLNGFQNVDNNRAKNFQSPRGEVDLKAALKSLAVSVQKT